MSCLEIGAGPGIFTKELVHMVRRLVVSDLSDVQLDLNRVHMRECEVFDLIDDFQNLDLADLSPVADESFDAVVCVGGAFSYLLDKASAGIDEILRVLKPNGIAVIGAMSLISTVVRMMGFLPADIDDVGHENMRYILETGIQDRKHYPITGHYCHMMTSSDVDALLANKPCEIIDRRAAGLLGLASEDALNTVKEDEKLWELIVEREIAWSKLPRTLDLGDNLLYVIRKA